MTNDKPEKIRAAGRPNDWTDVLAPEIIKQFVGRHIAIVYKRVVASGTTYDGVLEECFKLFPDETPYLAYIPTPEEALDEGSATVASNVSPSPFRTWGTPVEDVSPGPAAVPSTVSNGLAVHENTLADTVPDSVIEQYYSKPSKKSAKTTKSTNPPVDVAASEIAEESRPVPTESTSVAGIKMFSPVSGPVGTVVTVIGSDFTGASEVRFNETVASFFTVSSESSLSVLVPDNATTGVLTVVTPDGIRQSTMPFTVVPPPSILSISPTAAGIGNRVTINGANFDGATRVTFNGMAQPTIESSNSDSLVVDVPLGATSGKITVTTPAGVVTSEEDFEVVPAPSITSLSRSSGGVGLTVIIGGAELSSTTSVKFHGHAASEFTVLNSFEVSVVVPEGANTGLVSVSTSGGFAVSPTEFIVLPSPLIARFEPETAAAGVEVTLYGENLRDVETISFGGFEATRVISNSDTMVTVEVPADAASGPISLTTTGGITVSGSHFTVIPVPSIHSFLPVEAGIGASITINGSNLLGAAIVSFDGIDAELFEVESESVVTVIVPSGANSGPIEIVTPGGRSIGQQNFTVIPGPRIYAVTPSTAGRGSEIQIEGFALSSAVSVLFASVEAQEFNVVSDELLTVRVPENAETGFLKIVTAGGNIETEGEFTVVLSPELWSFSPESGLAGTIVTIKGLRLAESPSIAFGEIEAPEYLIVSDDSIEVTVPEGAYTSPITVATLGGKATSSQSFVLLHLPVIDSFTPFADGVGARITINGEYFDDVRELRFGRAAAEFSVEDSTSIVAEVPVDAETGAIAVVTAAGSITTVDSFTVIPAPWIHSVEPSSARAGSEVRLYGAHLVDVASVMLAGIDVPEFEVVSETSILVRLGDDAVDGAFSIVTPGGIATSDFQFHVTPPPVIEQISPTAGGIGSLVTITGENLQNVSSVTFEGTDAEEFTQISDTEVAVLVPATAISGVITVTCESGIATAPSKFVIVPAPVIKSFTPTLDGVGSKVMITGNFLLGTNAIKFNGGHATKFTVISATFVSVEVPADATTGPITVTTPGGSASSHAHFTIVPLPMISSISPHEGPIGTRVTISGENFTDANRITLGGVVQANFEVESPETIIVEVSNNVEEGIFLVSTPGGTVASTSTFTVIPLPTITSFTPLTGPIGTVITVNGNHLERANGAKVNDSVANIAALTPGRAKVFVPNDATTGLISITTPYGECVSTQEFEVITATAIKDVSPPRGVAGSFVTITGRGLAGASAVLFAGQYSPSMTVTSNTSITAQVPFGAQTGDVAVQVLSGMIISSKPYTVLLSATGIEPTSGSDGTQVTISGVGLSGATEVTFGGVQAEFEIISNTAISATAPLTGVDGPVLVVTPLGETSTPVNYFYPPAIIGVTPERGAETTLIAIAMSKNIDLSAEECEVEFSGGITVLPSFVDPMDNVVYVVVPAEAVTGRIRLTTRGGSVESPGEFEVIGE